MVKVSIIIPTLNAEKYIAALQQAFESQSLSIAELIVIDSKSEDQTVACFEAMGARVFSIKRESFQHAYVRNLGASYATGDYLVFMTQDVLPADEDWLANLIKPLCQGTASASFARQIPYEDANPLEQFARASNYPAESRIVSAADVAHLGGRAYFFSNSCSAIKKEVFDSLGGFSRHTIMNEDMLLASALLKADHFIAYTADALVKHSHNYSTWRTFQRYFDIGVVTKQAEADLAAAPFAKAGVTYVIRLFLYLLANRHFIYLPRAFAEAVAKWLGFRLGKLYAFYPQSVLRQVSMHGDYWNETRWFFSLSHQLLTPLLLILTDVLISVLCFGLAYMFRASILPLGFGLEHFNPAVSYLSLWPALAILLILRAGFGLYPGYGLSEAEELRHQTVASSLVLAFILAGGTLFRFWEYYSRTILLFAAVLILFLLPIARAGLKQFLARFPFYGTPIWLIGQSARAYAFKDILQANPVMGLKLIGHSAQIPQDTYAPYCLLVPDDLPQDSLSTLLDRLYKQFKKVLIAPGLLGMASAWVTPRDIKGQLTLELKNLLLEPQNELLKRCFDFVFSTVLLVLLFPLGLLLAFVVAISSKSMPIFKQDRVGRYGKLFTTYKFRTMYREADSLLQDYLSTNADANKEWLETRKLKNDPRITPLGRFLRRSSLDELPQLINIWKGDMSFVGPRPIVERELDYYGENVHLYQQAIPGLSGLAQVSGRSDLSYDERVRLDAYYARNWSIWLDIVIIAKTLVVVLKGKGAY